MPRCLNLTTGVGMDASCAGCGAVLQSGSSYCATCGQPTAGDEPASPAAAPGAFPLGGPPASAASPASPARSALLQLPLAHLILGGATVLLFIALLLPWWSVTAIFVGTVSLDGFHSWGWLSFIAWLLALGLSVQLIARPRALAETQLAKLLDNKMVARLVVATGVAELLGNLFFIFAAPSGGGAGYSAGISSGVVIAIVAGLAILYSGLLLLGPAWLPKPKGKAVPPAA